jgi:hypothetical protein
VPGGDYYLNFDFESGDFKSTDQQEFTINVWRDVPGWSGYFWCLFFISIIPGITGLRVRSFEVARWSNSDYSPYASSS